MVCQHCGTPATGRDQFCRGCGGSLSGSTRGRGQARSGLAVPLGVGAVCVGLLMLLVATVQSVTAGAAGGSPTGPTWSPPPVVVTTVEPSWSPTPTATPGDGDGDGVDDLRSHVPPDIVGTCMPTTVDGRLGRDLVDAVRCVPPGSRAPDWVQYWRYASEEAVQAAYRYVVRHEASAKLTDNQGCPPDGGRGTWTVDGVDRGSYVCYQTDSDGGRIWWTSDGLPVLAVAAGPSLSNDRAWSWFTGSNTGPR